MNEIEQIEQVRAGVGNTDLHPPKQGKQGTQSSYWFFTLNNYEIEQIEQIEQVLKHECEWFVFQEEIGESGTPHLQGTIKLKVRQRLTQLKCIDPGIHWEPTKSVKASIAYCSKEASRNGSQWVHGITLPKVVKTHEPYGWQKQVIDIIATEPDERTIHWFWEPTGNVGKTCLCKYLVVKHNALMLTGKSNDMYNMLAKYPDKQELILVDCPRSQQDYINYGAMEQIKNGLVFSGKYEGAQLVFNCPHIFVFANQEPDLSKMSGDRWNIVRIS
ncbi:hypothetical protein ES705_40910 [subsurface metagenome]